MAILAGLTEITAGVAFAAGFLTPLAAGALIGVMVNAAVSAHGEAGLWAENHGYEYPLVLTVIFGAVTLVGPGEISVDAALGWELAGAGWALAALLLGIVSAGAILATRHSRSTETVVGQR